MALTNAPILLEAVVTSVRRDLFPVRGSFSAISSCCFRLLTYSDTSVVRYIAVTALVVCCVVLTNTV